MIDECGIGIEVANGGIIVYLLAEDGAYDKHVKLSVKETCEFLEKVLNEIMSVDERGQSLSGDIDEKLKRGKKK